MPKKFIPTEIVWMLYSEKEKSLVYCVGSSAQEVWEEVVEQEIMGTGADKFRLQKRGYVAKRVKLEVL